MQFSRLAVLADSSVVVNAVGGVGILLYLSDKYALADGVQCSRLYKEHIALVYRHIVRDLQQSVVSDPLRELFLAYLVLETVEQFSALVTVNHIPHLGLAVLALDPHRVVVVGVYLHRKVVLCIYQLYQYREILEPLTVLAQYFSACLFDILFKCQPRELALSHYACAVLVAGKLPAFRDLVIVAVLAVFISQSCAAPKIILESGSKFKNSHSIYPFSIPCETDRTLYNNSIISVFSQYFFAFF